MMVTERPDRVALLDGGKVSFVLDPESTRILKELVNEYNMSGFNVEQSGDKYAITYLRFNRSFKLIIPESGPPVARIRIRIRGTLEEASESIHDGDWRKVERQAERQVAVNIEQLQKQMQKKGLDPIGFGLRYRAMGYTSEEDWERWQDMYPDMKMEFDVKVKLFSTGLVN